MPIAEVDFEYIRKLVRDRSAIVLERDKQYLAESRLQPLAQREGFPSLGEMIGRLRASPPNGLHRKVIEAMTTNETSFFRDITPFEAMKKVILPDLVARRATERRLNIWCAACSSGQEPYSIAMLIREHFPALAGWNVKILATDLSGEILNRAKNGRYSQLEVNRGMPAGLLVKYFEKHGVEWQVREELRRMIEFREMNLVENWSGIPAMDVVFLRNVMIYFDVEVKKTILRRLRQTLRPDGYLFLGGAETTYNLEDAYHRVTIEKASCYRLERPAQSN